MAIGSAKGMVDSGEWQSDPQPRLPISYSLYKVLWRIGFQYQSYKFLGEYLRDPYNNSVWFVKPYEGEFSDKIIVFSDKIKPSKYWQRDIYNPDIKKSKNN